MFVCDQETGIIRMCRGDDVKVALFIDCGDDDYASRQYILNDTDTVYFAVLELQRPFEQAILCKSYTSHSEKDDNGNLYITLDSSDTLNLLPGKYHYTIKMSSIEDGKNLVTTIVPERELYIE